MGVGRLLDDATWQTSQGKGGSFADKEDLWRPPVPLFADVSRSGWWVQSVVRWDQMMLLVFLVAVFYARSPTLLEMSTSLTSFPKNIKAEQLAHVVLTNTLNIET